MVTGLVALAITACEPTENPPNAGLDEGCTAVSWQVFYSDPLAFDRAEMCIEGRVIVRQSEINLYPPEEEVFWEAPAYIALGRDADALQEAGVRPGDIVRLSGTPIVEATCPSPAVIFNEDDRNPDCDAPIVTAQFERPQIEILESGRASAICETVDAAAILANPARYNHRIICTEGVVAIQDATPKLAPRDLPVGYATRLIFFGSSGPLIHFPQPLLGESIQLAGLLELDEACLAGEYASFEPYQLTGEFIDYMPPCEAIDLHTYEQIRTNPRDPWQTCQSINLQSLWERPLEFESHLVCLQGELVSPDNAEDQFANAVLQQDQLNILIYGLAIGGPDGLTIGEQVELAGYVDTWEECLLFDAANGTDDPIESCSPLAKIEVLEARPSAEE